MLQPVKECGISSSILSAVNSKGNRGPGLEMLSPVNASSLLRNIYNKIKDRTLTFYYYNHHTYRVLQDEVFSTPYCKKHFPSVADVIGIVHLSTVLVRHNGPDPLQYPPPREPGQLNAAVRGVLREHSTLQPPEHVGKLLLGALCPNKAKALSLCAAVLDFQCRMLGELHGAVDPVHSTDKLTVNRECILARQAGPHLHPAQWAVGWERVLLDVKLDSIAPPFEGVGLTGDLEAGLCDHVNTTEVAWRGREEQTAIGVT